MPGQYHAVYRGQLNARQATLRAAGVFVMLALGPGTSFGAWLFEPSAGLDQRFDDNYLLDDSIDSTSLSATRGFAGLDAALEKRASAFRGRAVIGRQLIVGDERAEGSESDGLLELDSVFRTQRWRYGVDLGYGRTTTAQDGIVSDLTEEEDIATDPGLVRGSSVDRGEYTLRPNVEYDLTRRTLLQASLEYRRVNYALPSAQDLIFNRYLERRERLIADNEEVGPLIPFDEVTIDDAGGPFQVARDALVDFEELEFELGTRFKLSPITTLTGKFSRSDYVGQVDADPALFIPFEDLEFDPDNGDVQRRPTRDSRSTTSRITLGLEHALSPILSLGVEGGLYNTRIDKSDTARNGDLVFEGEDAVRVDELSPEARAFRFDPLITEDDGWLANLSLTRDDGIVRYVGKYSVDVRASSVGTQVEATTVTGDVFWQLNPRTELSFRARAYEPRTIAADDGEEDDDEGNEFSRRFISFEPRVNWRYSRAWTVSAAYRYRRQRAETDDASAESSALLFTVRYQPPSALRAAADEDGF